MKALFFLLDGSSNASTRYRALQYFPLLRAHGIEPEACFPVPDPLYARWIEHGRGTTREKAAFYGLFLTLRAAAVARAGRYDVVVIQRDLFPFGPPLLERLLFRVNPRLVYDTDDATWIRPGFTPNTVWQRLRRFDKVDDVVRHARWVSVATEPIAAWARERNPNVAIVPMAVDLDEYNAALARRAPRQPGPAVLGWTGTAGGLRYLEALAPALRRVAERHQIVVRVVSGAYRQVSLPGLEVDARPWRAEADLDEVAAWDVGLVPLDDAPFERAKFPGKLLRCMALEVPAVCSPVGATAHIVTDGVDGLLAGTLDEWEERLDRLLSDVALRRRIAQAARATVEARYTLERVGPVLAAGLKLAAGRTEG